MLVEQNFGFHDDRGEDEIEREVGQKGTDGWPIGRRGKGLTRHAKKRI